MGADLCCDDSATAQPPSVASRQPIGSAISSRFTGSVRSSLSHDYFPIQSMKIAQFITVVQRNTVKTTKDSMSRLDPHDLTKSLKEACPEVTTWDEWDACISKTSIFYDQQKESLIVQRVLIIGLLFCEGPNELKADLLWAMTKGSESSQSMTVDHPRFYPLFQELIEISCRVFSRLHDSIKAEFLVEFLTVAHVYRLHEDYHEQAFGGKTISKVDKHVWIHNVTSNAAWIFHNATVCDYVYKLLTEFDASD